MRTIIIGYDLNKPGQDYSELISAIKKYSDWWHYLDSTWIVKTNLSVVEVLDGLRRYLDKGDEMLAIDISNRPAAWVGFDAKGDAWLKDKI